MSTMTINLTIPKALLVEIDEFARHEHTSRSDIFRVSVLEKLRRQNQKTKAERAKLLKEMLVTASELEQLNVSDAEITAAVKQLRHKEYRHTWQKSS